ncbi:MAG: NADH dehydrogenase [Bacteroidetes bacterium RIFCSPLOWO2_02_FULL_36_8]|nr:MAG: NADH dehydrogenase [Bacteroidetes bacterium RIFCSPLOWO2_02_FULL_36_8]OFY70823.1 MAG: NADH dehydrogenase [Bacteroidetes bacterium RIFCSPLOWO2_12_FULL_37_12]
MPAIPTEIIEEKLKARFPESILQSVMHDIHTLVVDKNKILEIIKYLYEEETLGFRFLTTLCGLHFPKQTGAEIGAMYQLHNLETNTRIRLKAFMPVEKPEIDSVTPVFSSANWQERETYDFFGIIFKGHPNLKRILNLDTMEVFPLRKEYPLQENTRKDKDDKWFGR